MEDSSFALGADGTLWAWGDNGKGQFGTGRDADSVSPIRVEGVSDIVSLSAVSARVVALRGDGTIWGWGLDHITSGSKDNLHPLLLNS
jgi:alpha-tubulin suppressor-like RCC1 family protein